MKKLKLLLPAVLVLIAAYQPAGTLAVAFPRAAFRSQGTTPPPPPPAGYILYMQKPTPVQPVVFSHMVHIKSGLQCMSCHSGITKQPEIGFPTVSSCMDCHRTIAADDPEVKKLAEYAAKKQDISWQLVFRPDEGAHVGEFDHAPHLDKGLTCEQCHGDMSKATVTARVKDAMMAACEGCHAKMGVGAGDDEDFGACTQCHTQPM